MWHKHTMIITENQKNPPGVKQSQQAAIAKFAQKLAQHMDKQLPAN